MTENYWLVINALKSALNGTLTDKNLREARLALSIALDKRVVYQQPSEDITQLLGVLDGLTANIER